MRKQFWLVKQEPEAYSWDDFVREGETAWTGIRNFQARNHLRSMRLGDWVFFYHSVSEKRVVGLAQVVRERYPDPTAQQGMVLQGMAMVRYGAMLDSEYSSYVANQRAAQAAREALLAGC